jgi:RimJ/RimL family protein N-acetyltransferase
MNDSFSITLSLRPTTAADLPALFEFQKDADAIHMAAFTPPDPFDKDAFIMKWTRLIADPTITERTVVLADGTIVGSIGTWLMEGEPQVSYWIDRSFWGRGVATQALRLFLEEQRARPLYGRVAFDNRGSMRVLEKCGFVLHAHDRGFANARSAEIDEAVFILR